MTYEQFWRGDPWLCVPYREYHNLSIQQRNEELWLQGLYVHNAFAVAINNAFSNKKIKYITKPIDIIAPSEDEKQEKIRRTRQKLVEKLNAFKDEWERKQQRTPN
jgi:hypothetical protein